MKNGVIKLDEDFIVDWTFTTYDLKKVGGKHLIEPVVINGSYESYKSVPIDFMGKRIIPTLYFESGEIARLSIYLSTGQTGWTENIAKQEQQKKTDQDAWLKSIFNQDAPYDFDWGKVESVYDPRSCSSSVVITFNVINNSTFGVHFTQ